MSSISFQEDEAINLLSLDGGGVRGVSSLVILDEIMKKIKEKHGLAELPKPCEFFHMMAGTSTGGLIAIMLGRLRMSTTEALAEYDNCAAEIFSRGNRKTWSLSEKFRATALQEVVQDIVKRREMGEKMYEPQRPEKGKVVVCVMPSDNIGQPELVHSSRDPDVEHPWDEDVAIWEAARATTAASSFFKPQKLGSGPNARAFIDAAIGVNNPVQYLLSEAGPEFGSGRRLGCVVSIGTGTRHVQFAGRKMIQALGYFKRLIDTLKTTATDCEEAHRQLQSRLQPFPGSYFRFNVPEAAELVKLHHYKKIPQLKSLTAKYLAREDVSLQVEQLAEGLKMDSFDHGMTLGHISGFDKEQVVLANVRAKPMGTPCPFFTGRIEILERLDLVFASRNTKGNPRREFLLFGMAGVGKSEIARKVAQDLDKDEDKRFEYIFFIDGSTPVTIDQSYARIAKRHCQGEGNTRAMKKIAMEWMEELTVEWLMIFDDCNLEDRQSELPGRGRGNIIYTSRLSSLKHAIGADNVLEVGPFREEEAIELLLKGSGSNSASLDAQKRAVAQEIVRELGCLPLAVGQAAVSIRDGYSTLDGCLQKLRTKKVRLMTDPAFSDENIENLAVYAALELSCEAVMRIKRREGRTGKGRAAVVALKILRLLSFYHHKDISVMVMDRAARQRREANADIVFPFAKIDKDLDELMTTHEDGSWNNHNFYVGLKLLWRFSFVSVEPRTMTISMHVLVKQWTHFKFHRTVEAHNQWCLAARTLLNEAFTPSTDLTDKQFAIEQSAHVDACFAAGAVSNTIFEPLAYEAYEARLHHKMGWYYMLGKQFRLAEAELRESLDQFRRLYGNRDWSTIEALWCLAQLYHEMGRLVDSELTYWEMIDRLEDRYEDRDAFLKKVIHRQQHENADGTSETSAQQVPPEASNSVSDGPAMGAPKRLTVPSPKRLSQRFLKTPSKGNPTESPSEPNPLENQSAGPSSLPEGTSNPLDTLDVLTNAIHCMYAELSYVLMDKGKYSNGKRMLLTMVERLEESMEEHNPELLKHKYQAQRLTDPKNTEYWKKHMDHALDLSGEESAAFWRHDCSYALMLGFANCLVENEQWADASRNLHELKSLVLKIYGQSDRRLLDALRLQVKAKRGEGNFSEAVEVARECVWQAEVTYGKIHKETVLAMEQLVLAIFYHRLDFDDECRAIMQDALERSLAAHGPTHPATKRIRHVLETCDKAAQAPDSGVEANATLEVNTSIEPGTAKKTDIAKALTRASATQWGSIKAHVEKLVATLGSEHPVTKRLNVLVEAGPVKSHEDWLERLQGSFGPDSQITKDWEATLGERDASLARIILGACVETETGRIPSARWKMLEENVEEVGTILGPENVTSVRMKALTDGGPTESIVQLLERLRRSFGPDSSVTRGVEEGLRERGFRLDYDEAAARPLRWFRVMDDELDDVAAEGSWQAEARAAAEVAEVLTARTRAAKPEKTHSSAFAAITPEPAPEPGSSEAAHAGEAQDHDGAARRGRRWKGKERAYD